jgi:hypothetical protein
VEWQECSKVVLCCCIKLLENHYIVQLQWVNFMVYKWLH